MATSNREYKLYRISSRKVSKQKATTITNPKGEGRLWFPGLPNIKCPKFIRHANKQESMAHTQWEKKQRETVTEEAQTLDLLGKNFKSDSLNMFKNLYETACKELKQWEICSNKKKLFVKLWNCKNKWKIH